MLFKETKSLYKKLLKLKNKFIFQKDGIVDFIATYTFIFIKQIPKSDPL